RHDVEDGTVTVLGRQSWFVSLTGRERLDPAALRIGGFDRYTSIEAAGRRLPWWAIQGLLFSDLDVLRARAAVLRERLAGIRGLADLEIEKQVLAPQIRVRIDHAAAARHGVSASHVLTGLQTLVEGERITQVVEGSRRFDLVLRLPDSARAQQGLERIRIDTPSGAVPLSRLAAIEEADGPNQISRDDGRRRIVISANAQGRALSDVVADVRATIDATPMPEGYFVTLGGQFQAQEEASRLIGGLAAISALGVFVVLYARYRSGALALLVMGNVPLALAGGIVGLKLSGQPLSVAALVGLVTLAGIATRNGILKVGHWIHLMREEGERFDRRMIVRGSLERLAPVLMTALTAALALSPLLFEAEQPGTEILHPVAVVIFSGLIGSTLLDAFVTPVMFARVGERPVRRLLAEPDDAMHAHPAPVPAPARPPVSPTPTQEVPR
nr:efflux RND transporter permease subunit [Burkholderiaceae bacterium]